MEENKDLGLSRNSDNNETFGYNNLYQNMVGQQQQQQQDMNTFASPVMEQAPITFESNKPEQNIVAPTPSAMPTFDTNSFNTSTGLEQNIDNHTTFDYNQLYQNATEQNQPLQQQDSTPNVTPIMEQTPIIFEDNKPEQQEVVSEIIPTFDTNALEEDLPEELRPKVEEPLIQSMTSDAQKEKKEERQNLLFIIIFFAVLIVAVVVVFPLLAGI